MSECIHYWLHILDLGHLYSSLCLIACVEVNSRSYKSILTVGHDCRKKSFYLGDDLNLFVNFG